MTQSNQVRLKLKPKDKREAIQQILHEIDLLESEIQRKSKVGQDVSDLVGRLKVLEKSYEERIK